MLPALFEAVEAYGRRRTSSSTTPAARVRGALVDLPPEDVKRAIEISAFGAFLVSQQAAKRMLPRVTAPSCCRAPPPA